MAISVSATDVTTGVNIESTQTSEIQKEKEKETNVGGTEVTTVGATNENDGVEEMSNNNNDSSLWIIFLCFVPLLLLTLTRTNESAHDGVRLLTDELEKSDTDAKTNIANIRQSLQKVEKETPEVAENETYKSLLQELETMEKTVENKSVQHNKVCNIYRKAYKIDEKKVEREKSNKTLKPINISGYTLLPYRNQEEYDNIKNEYPSIPEFVQEKNKIHCCFIAIDKKSKKYVAEFIFECGCLPDAVNIKYGTEDDVQVKFICKSIRRLAEYCYTKFDTAYYFFELDGDDENVAKIAKKYQLRKCDGSNEKYYIDINEEQGIVSVISTL